MIKVVLSDDQNLNEGLPREYDIKNCSKPEISNTFVFTEKDSKKRKFTDAKEGLPEIPRRLLWKNDERAEKKTKRDEGRYQEREKKEVFIKAPHRKRRHHIVIIFIAKPLIKLQTQLLWLEQ